MLALTLLVFLVSMYFNLDRIRRDLIGTFYAPHTRFWELMAGAVLAHLATCQGAIRCWRACGFWYEPLTHKSSRSSGNERRRRGTCWH